MDVHVELLRSGGLPVARIDVSRATQLTATTDGIVRRRRLKPDGTPETVPFLPHEFASRQSVLGLLDFTVRPVAEAGLDDLDPLERVRLRQLVEQYGGDAKLLDLEDDALDGALGLTTRRGDRRVPTILGPLLIGHLGALRTHLPPVCRPTRWLFRCSIGV